MRSIITLENIVKTYTLSGQQTVVLNNISLRINQGEMVAITGPSGSGKSTLLHVIGLLDKACKGAYHFREHAVTSLSPSALADLRNRTMGFVFQQFHLLPRFNARYNVALPLLYRHHSTHQAMKAADELLDRLGLLSLAHHRPAQLSGGQQQRVAIARALIGNPDVILADEPTGSLDSTTSQQIMTLLKELHQEGRTILMVTHDAQLAAQCTRQITLHDGRTA